MKIFINNLLLFFLLVLLYGCGFTPIYKLQSTNFYLSQITSDNENNQYHIFKNIMRPYMNDDKEISYEIKINLEKTKKTISKDSNGNPLIYMMRINAQTSIQSNYAIISSKNYEKKFKYNYKSNIFDLNLYENEIEKNLIKLISDEIIMSIINLNQRTSTSKNYGINKIKIKGNSEIGYGKSS